MAGVSKRAPGQLVRCTKCGEWKPWTPGVFKAEKGKPRQPCVPCDSQQRQRRANANPEHKKTSARTRTARWRERHPDKVQAANRGPRKVNREKSNARIRMWKKAHPVSAIVAHHQRKARRQKLPSSFTRAEWLRCLDFWEHRCCICGRPEGDGYALALDHWIAISDPRPDNPGHVAHNILPMCHARGGVVGGCNNAKWNRDPVEWVRATLTPADAEERLQRIAAYFALVRRCLEVLG